MSEKAKGKKGHLLRNLLLLGILIAGAGVGLSYAMGWITVSAKRDRPAVGIDAKKAKQDVEKAVETGKKLVGETGKALEKTGKAIEESGKSLEKMGETTEKPMKSAESEEPGKPPATKNKPAPSIDPGERSDN